MSILRIPTAKAFEPLLGPARYKGAYGGRGSGKSHFFAECAVERSVQFPGTRIVCVREVQKSLKDSVKRLVEDKIKALGVGAKFRVTTDSIAAPGGGVIVFQGMQDSTAESIKSLEGFDVAYVEEAQRLTERSLELLRPTIRKDGSELWFSWNPRSASDPVDQLLRGPAPPSDSTVVAVSYTDNPFFPAVLEEERVYDEAHKQGRYAHIWLGAYEPAAIGAIWDRLMFHRNRKTLAEVQAETELRRVVVGVDHAVSNEPGSNEHGIIVVAEGADQRGYVLDDTSRKGTPRQWAERAVAAFDRWDADTIVIERNQGGDLVANNLRTVRAALPITEVVATRGKHVRAEPISALYEQNKVSHVGTFAALEDQMCLMTAGGYDGTGSPDRVDALVWALTELFPALTVERKEVRERDVMPAVESESWMAA